MAQNCASIAARVSFTRLTTLLIAMRRCPTDMHSVRKSGSRTGMQLSRCKHVSRLELAEDGNPARGSRPAIGTRRTSYWPFRRIFARSILRLSATREPHMYAATFFEGHLLILQSAPLSRPPSVGTAIDEWPSPNTCALLYVYL